MKRLLRVARVCVLLCFSAPFSAFADITTGVNWLSTQQSANGGFGNTQASLATDVQASSEVARTLRTIGQPTSSVTSTIGFLNSNTDDNTEYLSRKIIANAMVGNDVSDLAASLLARQNADG